MLTKNYIINSPDGEIFAKQWTPDKLNSDNPIVLLHDSLGSTEQWRDFPEKLAQHIGRHVIAYDRLGFGKSTPRLDTLSKDFIKQEAQQYFPIVKHFFKLSNYILLGHSVGGGMALTIASLDKQCLGVISMSAQAFIEKKTLQGIQTAQRFFQDSKQMKRLEKWHDTKAKWVLDAWVNTWLSEDFLHWSLSDCIDKVSCPTLVIHGENDEYGSIAFAEFISSKSTGSSTQIIIQNCGHVPHKEYPQKVLDESFSFCSDLD
ncbi:MAG: alpha/beta hydrolase [Candidatus Cloacimonetes bacterium]|nr:alpha/beta hydrolase [Candidatus Cloacimonadota bacterium]